jgi:hypothetical protein
MGPKLIPLQPGTHLVGRAFPVTIVRVDRRPEVPYVGLLRALDAIGGDDVYVVSSGGAPTSRSGVNCSRRSAIARRHFTPTNSLNPGFGVVARPPGSWTERETEPFSRRQRCGRGNAVVVPGTGDSSYAR